MNFVVFGASREVGLEVVKQALEAGHTVTAFVRSPEKLTMTHPSLTVFKGDALDTEAVEKAITGQDAVISALGPTRSRVPRLMETSAKNIVAGISYTNPSAFNSGVTIVSIIKGSGITLESIGLTNALAGTRPVNLTDAQNIGTGVCQVSTVQRPGPDHAWLHAHSLHQ